MNLEEGLRMALKAEDPPAGFAERVIRKAAQRRQEAAGRRSQRFARTWMAVAAMFAAAALVTVEVRDYESRQEQAARKAGQQVVLALRIAGAKLHTTRKLLRRTTHAI